MLTDHDHTEYHATPEPHEPFTQGRSPLLAQVNRANHPDGVDLEAFKPAHRDVLSQAALWLAVEVEDIRSLEQTVIGPRAFHQSEQEILLRILLSVFLGHVNDVLRQVEAEQKADAEDKARAF